MLSSEVKELINLLKTKMTVSQDYIEKYDADGAFKRGLWFFFEDNCEGQNLYIDLEYYPSDPKELEQQKEEE